MRFQPRFQAFQGRPFQFVRQASSQRRISSAAWAYVKLKNAISFSGYTLLVAGGLGMTGYAGYCLWEELGPKSDVRIFQRAFKLVEKDPKVVEILGSRLKAHGEEVNHRAARTRPVAARRQTDRNGKEFVTLQFYVQSKEHLSPVRVEMYDGQFKLVMIELPGYGNHYVVGGVRPKARNALAWLIGRS